MLQKEFFERTGINLTEQEFNQVHAIYMQAGDSVDKDQFCADWKKHHDSNLLHIFYNQADRLGKELDKANNEINELAIYILEQAEVCSAPTLREKAIQMLGIETYLRIKIQKGYNLWQLDKDALVEILSKTK